ncbi:FAD-dependent oxidoreductase [Arthrobacter sulfonylureivorans]|uniref:FAD-dependent oxidoreductase n=1 Tax=Arthrobacter sulfonylureivorans TaxID=2486855 RepID=UPI0039E69D4B
MTELLSPRYRNGARQAPDTLHDVAVVGGGPVGLFMAILLAGHGLDVTVLEQRTARSSHSRAIGIHPPALAVLDDAGVGAALLAAGVRIRRGTARSRGREVASLSFASVPGPHPYVLAVPQVITEQLLEEQLEGLRPGALRRGVQVYSADDDGATVTLSCRLGARPASGTRAGTAPDSETCMGERPGSETSAGEAAGAATVPDAGPAAGPEAVPIRARLVVAADGAYSALRRQRGVTVRTRLYPDAYLMGDFADSTADGSTAVLYLEAGGIVESFPLPGGTRRWVARMPGVVSHPTAAGLASLIARRTGGGPEPDSCSMLSAFSVSSRMPRRLVSGRLALIGDAAHQISPIGGQGMNLGWLDAAALAPIVAAALRGEPTARALRQFEADRRRAAATATWQAHLNMALGRPLPSTMLAARNHLFGALTHIPGAQDAVANRFTMH